MYVVEVLCYILFICRMDMFECGTLGSLAQPAMYKVIYCTARRSFKMTYTECIPYFFDFSVQFVVGRTFCVLFNALIIHGEIFSFQYALIIRS